MTDQQPENPAARLPENTTPADPTRIDGPAAPHPDPTRIDTPAEATSRPDPTRIATPSSPSPGSDSSEAGAEGRAGAREGAEAGGADETHAPGDPAPPARWSGSAAVPAHVPKRPWWARRRSDNAPDQPAPPADPWADSEDWSATPAVDPWADQDTPWQAELPFPEAMPPTRIDSPLPPTRMDAPLPPTRTEAPLPPTRMEAPLPPTRMEVPSPPAWSEAPLPRTRGVVPPPAQPAASLSAGQAEALLRRAQAQPRPTAAPRQPQARPATAPQPPQARPATTSQPPAAGQPAATPVGTRGNRRGWGRRKPPTPPPPNRIPVQTRPPAPPQAKPPPPAPRRKRRWPRRLFLFTLVSVVCCCGVPAYLAWPAAQQYPVSAALPGTVNDLDLRDDGASRRAVERLSEQLAGTSLVEGDVFAGVYGDGNGKRVTLFGTTGLRFTPESDVEAEIAHLVGEYDITDVQPFDLGETGVHERCGVGRSGGKAVVVCAWADHGSLATVLLTRRSVEESAELTGVLRSAVLSRG